MTLQRMSQSTMRRNADKFRQWPTEYGPGKERDLQRDAERYIMDSGYWPLTDLWLSRGTPPLGWYEHRPPKTDQGQAYALDIRLWRADPCLWADIELKTATGRLTGRQRDIIESSDRRVLCRNVYQVRDELLRLGMIGDVEDTLETAIELLQEAWAGLHRYMTPPCEEVWAYLDRIGRITAEMNEENGE